MALQRQGSARESLMIYFFDDVNATSQVGHCRHRNHNSFLPPLLVLLSLCVLVEEDGTSVVRMCMKIIFIRQWSIGITAQ